MTATNFIYWLQGFMELADPKTITKEQLDDIKDHLRLAFKDDIDPKMGDAGHQQVLSDTHSGKLDLGEFFSTNPHLNTHGNTFKNDEPLERC